VRDTPLPLVSPRLAVQALQGCSLSSPRCYTAPLGFFSCFAQAIGSGLCLEFQSSFQYKCSSHGWIAADPQVCMITVGRNVLLVGPRTLCIRGLSEENRTTRCSPTHSTRFARSPRLGAGQAGQLSSAVGQQRYPKAGC
jgi:hypothetical protein